MHRFYRNTVEHVFFGSGQFSELANLVFETVEISEFAHVEFLPMPIKVNSAERLTHRFSVQAPYIRSWCLLQNSSAMHYDFPCYLLLVHACTVVT